MFHLNYLTLLGMEGKIWNIVSEEMGCPCNPCTVYIPQLNLTFMMETSVIIHVPFHINYKFFYSQVPNEIRA